MLKIGLFAAAVVGAAAGWIASRPGVRRVKLPKAVMDAPNKLRIPQAFSRAQQRVRNVDVKRALSRYPQPRQSAAPNGVSAEPAESRAPAPAPTGTEAVAAEAPTPAAPPPRAPAAETAPAPAEEPAAAASGKIDLNTATVEELQTLPGVGAARAQAIIELREKDGPILRVRDLQKLPGVSKGAIDAIRPLVVQA